MDKQVFEKIKAQIIESKKAGATEEELLDVNLKANKINARLAGWTNKMLKMVQEKSSLLKKCVFHNESLTYDEFMKEYNREYGHV
jgi:hypothetical protein